MIHKFDVSILNGPIMFDNTCMFSVLSLFEATWLSHCLPRVCGILGLLRIKINPRRIHHE